MHLYFICIFHTFQVIVEAMTTKPAVLLRPLVSSVYGKITCCVSVNRMPSPAMKKKSVIDSQVIDRVTKLNVFFSVLLYSHIFVCGRQSTCIMHFASNLISTFFTIPKNFDHFGFSMDAVEGIHPIELFSLGFYLV